MSTNNPKPSTPSPEVKTTPSESITRVIDEIRSVETKGSEAKANATSIKDATGKRIILDDEPSSAGSVTMNKEF